MAQHSYPWLDVQYKLGEARVYYVTKKYWCHAINKYSEDVFGAPLRFYIPDEIIEANEKLVLPAEGTV